MTFTKEQLIIQAQENVEQWQHAMRDAVGREYAAIRLRLAEIALAALTAEPAKCGHVNLDCDDGKAVCLSCGKVWEV